MKKEKMKKLGFRNASAFLIAFMGSVSAVLGQGTVTPNMGTLTGQVQSNFAGIIKICNYGAGLVLFIGMVWGLYAMVTNNQSARNYAIGFVLGFCFWAIVNAAVGTFMN